MATGTSGPHERAVHTGQSPAVGRHDGTLVTEATGVPVRNIMPSRITDLRKKGYPPRMSVSTSIRLLFLQSKVPGFFG